MKECCKLSATGRPYPHGRLCDGAWKWLQDDYLPWLETSGQWQGVTGCVYRTTYYLGDPLGYLYIINFRDICLFSEFNNITTRQLKWTAAGKGLLYLWNQRTVSRQNKYLICKIFRIPIPTPLCALHLPTAHRTTLPYTWSKRLWLVLARRVLLLQVKIREGGYWQGWDGGCSFNLRVECVHTYKTYIGDNGVLGFTFMAYSVSRIYSPAVDCKKKTKQKEA